MTTETHIAETREVEPKAFVGLGASAGGLGALKRFFEHTPTDSQIAFVVVTHLSPEHESHLAELLQRHTEMPVMQVSGEQRLRPNHVYVIPPGRNLSAIDTHLRLSPLESNRRERAPIDHFFRTLSEAQRERAVVVVLTGTGSDGSVGLSLVKERGGFVVAQDPAEAEYDGMPQSAITTGLVDMVLPLREMPDKIIGYVTNRPNVRLFEEEEPLPEEESKLLRKLFTHLRAGTHHDFSGYKRTTVMRRIARRMQIRGVGELGAYLELVRRQPDELKALFSDLLITVTNFFRDKEVFEVLEQRVIPELFRGKGPGDVLRVWGVGCATGEEAYSLAMLLLEHASTLDNPPELQIFATDVFPGALERARGGFYPRAIEMDVTETRLKRFFTPEGEGYRINAALREQVLFASHNVLSDPPFSKIDLLVCRNMLIYLQREVQEQVFGLFHYALREDGLLLLGTSESVEGAELFLEFDKRAHLFRRKNPVPASFRLPSLPFAQPGPLTRALPERKRSERERGYGALHQRLVERYAPPSVLIDPQGSIVHFSERASRYVRQPGGEPTQDLLKRVHEPLQAELRVLLHEVSGGTGGGSSRPIALTLEGEPREVTIHASRRETAELAGATLIIFDEREVSKTVSSEQASSGEVASEKGSGVGDAGARAQGDGSAQDRTIRRLEEALAASEARLRSMVDDHEGSREEMQATNEELQSMNEELRSVAEELETSKEELQSLNEELITANQENRNKVEELSQLTSDLQNLFAATNVATLFLDRELRVKRFTPRVGELFNILPSDINRPVAHLTNKLGQEDFVAEAHRVLRTLAPVEREVRSETGRWYLMQLLPYRTTDHRVEDRIDGIVLTLIDIDAIKRSEELLRASEERYRAIFEQSVAGISLLDVDHRVIFVNDRFCNLLGYTREELLSLRLQDLTDEDALPRNLELLERMWTRGEPFELEKCYRCKDGGYLWMHDSVSPLFGEGVQPQATITVTIDISRRQQAEAEATALNETLERRVAERTAELEASNQELRNSQRRFTQAFEVGPVAACITTLGEERFLEVNEVFLELTGYERGEVLGKTARALGMWSSPEDRATLERVESSGESFRNLELKLRTKAGDVRDITLSRELIRLDGEHGNLKMFYDISDRKRNEEQIHEAIQEVMTDTNWFSHQVLVRLANLKAGKDGGEVHEAIELSRREKQVLSLVAQGKNNEAIGDELGIATQTVRNYISTVYDKIGVHTRAEAVVWARERGFGGG